MSRIVLAALVCALWATPARAQLFIDGGLNWSGGYPIGVSDASLRTNAPGAAPPPFTLFTVDSRMAGATGGEVRVGWKAGQWSVEGSAAYARRALSFSVAGDTEGANGEFDGESVQHYEFGGGVTWQLPRLHTDRLQTFAAGGATYLRQLHQDRTLVETGGVLYGGAGVRYWLWRRPDSDRSLGVRGDVRINVSQGAIDFENTTRAYPSLSLLLFLSL